MVDQNTKLLFYFLAGAVLLLYILMPMFYPVVGHDSWIHMNWLSQFTSEFRNGNYYPRWMPMSFFGMGAPSFYFYPPLTYWIASFVSYLQPQNAEFVYYTTLCIGTAVATVTSYFYFRCFVDNKHLSLLASLCYILMPYSISNIYRRAAFTEQFGIAILPLFFIGIEMLEEVGQRKFFNYRSAALFFIGVTLLLSTNIPLTVGMLVVGVVYFFARYGLRRVILIKPVLIGIVAAVLATSFYWLPIIELSPSVRTDELTELYEILKTQQNTVSDNDMLFNIAVNGMTLLVVCVTVCAAFIYRRLPNTDKDRNILRTVICVGLLTCMFQCVGLAVGIEDIPILNLLQFPWRIIALFLPFIPLVLIIVTGALMKLRLYTVAALASVSLTLGVGYLFSLDASKHIDVSSGGYRDVTEYVTKYSDGDAHELTRLFASYAHDSDVVALNDNGKVVIEDKSNNIIVFKADFDTTTVVRFRRGYFPLWKLIDEMGKEYQLNVDRTTRFTATLPEGKHQYMLSLKDPATHDVYVPLTALGLLSGIVLIAMSIVKRS